MFSRISPLGVIFENLRGLSISLLAISIAFPLFGTELIVLVAGLFLGVYYGHRIESQIHEIRSLGGRILRAGEWDYLILA